MPRAEAAGVLDTFFFWHRTLSASERSSGAALAFALGAALLAASIRWSRPALRSLAILPAVAWGALLASTLLDPTVRGGNEAVITADEVVARAADSALAPSPFPAPLPGGTEVTLLEERAPFVRVRLANGRDAWITDTALSRIARRP